MNDINAIGVAVDLGSTTIAVSCLNLLTKEDICSFSFANPQCRYGADVITRIRHCIDDSTMLVKLGNLVWEQLFCKLSEYLGKDQSLIRRIIISGNTTMQHILRGLPVDGLAVAPFHPIDIEYREESILVKECPITIVYPPGFSAFVGADILTGAQGLGLGRENSYDLLIDLGTNGEMLLLNQKHGYAASTACGPVFDHVLTGASYGSECIRAIANCVKRGLIDHTGKIKEPFFENGIVIDKGFVIRQENVRNFQLAKAAIYAGIKCLCSKADISFLDIKTVYISGGLGFYMDIKDAVTVKMLPDDLKDKIVIAGNTSLEGAKKLLLAENVDVDKEDNIFFYYEKIRNRTESFELADMEGFQDIYMHSLDF
ncbi:MAG: ASKHA domain-containing protein [Clostridiales bacterium]|nr:ASKHA domain-containing protein [Clostridiales bacterium]